MQYKDSKAFIPITLSMAIFPLLPFFSILLFALVIALENKVNSKTFKIFIFLISTFLGLINSTKIPESDLLSYINLFKDIPNYSFFEYIFLKGKEPIYFSLNYLLYYLTNGNTNIYLILSTIISYSFFLLALFKFHKHINSSNSLIVFSILTAAFLPQLFSLSAHLNRQFLATSIFLYALILQLFSRSCLKLT